MIFGLGLFISIPLHIIYTVMDEKNDIEKQKLLYEKAKIESEKTGESVEEILNNKLIRKKIRNLIIGIILLIIIFYLSS